MLVLVSAYNAVLMVPVIKMGLFNVIIQLGGDMKLAKVRLIVAGAVLVFFCTCMNSFAYDHEVKDKKISFAWKIDGETLAVKMAAETDGWVGIGFNPSAKMKDANFVLGYVKKGEAKIIDEYGDSERNHTPDEKGGGSTDAVLVNGTEEEGVTTIEFTIPLNSGDKNDGVIDPNGDTIVLLAYGAGRDSFKSKHKYRSTFKVNLATGASQAVK